MSLPVADRTFSIYENPQRTRTSVLMIVGCHRSGSTILGSLLAEADRTVHVGELNYIWCRGLTENRRCGCGVPLRNCEFWQQVFVHAFGGFDQLDTEDILKTKSLIERTRALPKLFSQCRSPQISDRLSRYKQILAKLYDSIATVSGADVVIDSSKAPHYAYLVGMISEIDLQTIHLIRDSRAVAHSKNRMKPDFSVSNQIGYLGRDHLLKSSIAWNFVNGLLMARPPGQKSIFLRYEDFVADPGLALGKISKLMDGRLENLSSTEDHYEVNHLNHTVSGNPIRFESKIVIAPDMEWKEKMPASRRAVVTALTLPVLLRAGYSIT
jgi:hypothetical protein